MKQVSEHLKSRYKHKRYTSDENAWSPNQPKHFTNLELFHCNGLENELNLDALVLGNEKKHFQCTSKVLYDKASQKGIKKSKDVAEIFTTFDELGFNDSPATIVIEGAPGIGKTALSKEIAFQWAKGKLLLEKVLVFLIFLIDPMVQSIENILNLIQYFYQFDESCSCLSKVCADYLHRTQGRNVLFILDGYDELPEEEICLIQNLISYVI